MSLMHSKIVCFRRILFCLVVPNLTPNGLILRLMAETMAETPNLTLRGESSYHDGASQSSSSTTSTADGTYHLVVWLHSQEVLPQALQTGGACSCPNQ